MKSTLRSLLAVLAAMVGILLVASAVMFVLAALAVPPGERQAMLAATSGILAVLCLVVGILLIWFAGRTLRYTRVLQIGLGMVVVASIAILGWLQHAGAFDRSKVTLSNGVLLIQGPIDLELLVQFRQVLASADLQGVRVRLRSPGGTIQVAMAMGREIHSRQLDVEVDGFCISSCANYLFTAGRNKYVDSPEQVRFHGGALQPNAVAWSLELIEQGRQLEMGEDLPADLDLVRFRNLCGLADGFPINAVTNILMEKAFFEEIGVSSLTPVYGQYGDHAAWYDDGVHDNFYYLPEDYALLGVTNVIVTGPHVTGSDSAALFRARTSVEGVAALTVEMSELYGKIQAAAPLGAGDIWRSPGP